MDNETPTPDSTEASEPAKRTNRRAKTDAVITPDTPVENGSDTAEATSASTQARSSSDAQQAASVRLEHGRALSTVVKGHRRCQRHTRILY